MSASTTLYTFKPCAHTASGEPLKFAGNRLHSSAAPALPVHGPSRLLRFTLVALVLLAAVCSFAATVAPPVKAHLSSTLFVQPIGSGFQQPEQLAVDANGNVYIADVLTNNVYKETLVDGVYTQSILRANLGGPIGVAVDTKGNVFIADSDNSRVLEETLEPNGTYSESVVPTTGLGGIVFDLAVDSKGNLYIADALNNRVVKETATINGGYTQSTIPATGLLSPEGVAVDTQGNVYISDSFNDRIVKMTVSGLSYTQSVAVPAVSPLGPAGLSAPGQVVVVGSTLYIADTLNSRIAKATYNSTTKAYTLTTVATGSLNAPTGVGLDASGDLFVADTNNKRVIEVSPGSGTDFGGIPVGVTSQAATLTFTFDNGGKIGAPLISTVVGGANTFSKASGTTCTAGTTFATNATCTIAVTFKPLSAGIAYGAAELRDSSDNALATAAISGTGVGTRLFYTTNPFDSRAGAGLKSSRAVALDPRGDLYIADTGNNQVVELPLTGAQSIVVKNLKSPNSIAADSAGDVFITDSGNKRVIEETPAAGGTYSQTVVYGTAVSSSEDSIPGPVAVDRDGNLWIAFPGELDEYSLLSGTWTKAGTIDLVVKNSHGVAIPLPTPGSLAVDASGSIYVGEAADSTLNFKAEVMRLTRGPSGYYVEITVEQDLDPLALAVDRIGNVFMLDSGGHLHVYVPTGPQQHTTVSGTTTTYYLGVDLNTQSSMSSPEGLAVDSNDELYIANTGASTILQETWNSPASENFHNTVVDTVSSAIVQTILNVGNTQVNFVVPSTGQNPTISSAYVLNTGETDACPVLTSSSDPETLTPGAACSISVSFAPTATGNVTGSLTYQANVNNTSKFGFSLSGTGIATIPNISWSAPAAIAYGTPLSATQLNASANYNGQSVPGTFAYNPALGTVLSAGTHTLSVQFVPSVAGYSNASANVTITVTKVPLIIVADTFSRPYGSPNPTFTASYIGFVNGDGPGSLFGALTFSTDATQQFPWGYYPITVSSNGGSTQTNYTVTYVDGTLVITQVPLTVTANNVTVTNSSDIPNPYPCSFTGLVNGDTAAVINGGCATNAQNYSNEPSGSYTVTPTIGTLSALNYTFTSFAPGTLTISESQVKRGVTKVAAAKPVAPAKRPPNQRR